MKFLELLEGDLLEGVSGRAASAAANPEITGVEHDSRRVRPGFLFVAFRGESTDGNRYIDAALTAGAAAVVTDSAKVAPPASGAVAWARVEHGRRALARISARFYGEPARRMRLSGVTGTNGKTTTTFLLEAILNAAGRKSLLVGTIEYHAGGEVIPAPHTTPEALEIQRLMARSLAAGAMEAVMEASSHALAQERVYGLPFDVAVFTNLTRDHLDYHRDMDDYFLAKRALFAGCGAPPPRVAAINSDDSWGARLVTFCRGQGSEVVTYGVASGDFRAHNVELSPAVTAFDLAAFGRTVRLRSPLIGRVNVLNILAAAAAAHGRGCSLEEIAAGVAALERVPGRFERVDRGQPFSVVVDYAHTDDALHNVLSVARDFAQRGGQGGRVITLFGCGGDRDRKKRPLMGRAAGERSDFVVVTSDNPRSEEPMAIIHEALPGVEASGVRHAVEPDRRRAIALALREAKPGDIVILAGKGHEKVQVLATGPVPFDDVAVARAELNALGYGGAKAAPDGTFRPQAADGRRGGS